MVVIDRKLGLLTWMKITRHLVSLPSLSCSNMDMNVMKTFFDSPHQR